MGFTPISTGFLSVEFDMLLETNTTTTNISILNSLGKAVARLYLENEEKIAFMTYDSEIQNNTANDHIINTWNKQWVKVRADVDTQNAKVMWYINERPLSTTPVNMTREYIKDNEGVEGNDVIEAVELGYRNGVSVYADNLAVYTRRYEAITPASSYTVDNTYSMITGVPFGTKVGEFLQNVTPRGVVYSRSAEQRKNDEYIQPGDTVKLFSGENAKAFAIGLEGGSIDCEPYAEDIELYVSPTGNDNADGSFEAPFKTIEKALETAKQSEANAVIYLRGGIYNISDTIKINDFKNLTVKSCEGEEAVLIGGTELTFTNNADSTQLQRLDSSVRSKIVVADISGIEIGEFTQAGWDLPFKHSKAVLTKNGKTQTLARYPDSGYIEAGTVNSVSTSEVNFNYTGTEPETWQWNDNIYIWSFFGTEYGGIDINISEISTADKAINVKGDVYGTPKDGFKYYFFNVFEELNAQGEYYIDEENELLYYYPEDGYNTERMILGSTYSTLMRIEESDNVKIENIIFEGGRENAIEINNCINTIVRNCDIQGFGMNGVEIVGGFKCGVENSEISHIGADAVKLSAGDMYTLTPARHFVRGCDIHDFSERKTSYTSAVTMSGDGFEISANAIHSSPHMGLYLRASDVEIYSNNFYDLVQNAKDAGAIYAVDTYTRRGVDIYDNVFENIYNRYEPDAFANVKCIYLDNYTSGWTVHNNIFKNSDEGIHMNGGRENEFYDNVFVNMNSAMNIQNINGLNFTSAPYYQIDYYPLSSNLWKSHFSGIDEFTTVNKGYPNNTRTTDNVVSNVGRVKISRNAHMRISDQKTISKTAVTEKGGICDYEMYKNLILPIEPSTQRGFKIGEATPMAGVVYLEKGNSEDVYYFDGIKTHIPDSIKSSNETRVSVKGNKIYAVGDGGAYITLNYQGVESKVYVITNQYRLNK